MTLYIAGIIALQMYPGRRFALPWAISFCPFGAAGSMVDRYIPGPSTLAEGVPALRAYGMRGEFGGRESDRHAKLRITD